MANKIGNIVPITVNRFDGGFSDDPREVSSNKGALIKHFDIFSNPNKLTPFRSTEADTSTSVSSTDLEQYRVQDYQLGLDGKLYGLGRAAGSAVPKVFSKADPTTGNWTIESTAEGTGALIRGCFIEWQSAWWMFSGTTDVSKWTIGSTFTNSVGTVGTITSVAQGLVGADNNLYLFYNNKVVRVSPAGVATDNVFSAIPSDMRIVSACRWGSFIAIGCAYGTSNTGIPSGRSQVFIWDMVTTTTANDVIDWGEGALKVLGNIEGRIVGVSNKYLSNNIGLTKGAMVVRMWGGGQAKVIKEVVANQIVTTDSGTLAAPVTRFPRNVVIKDNRMYWAASVPFGLSTSTESTFHLGIWGFGRKNVNSDYALTIEYVEEATDTSNYFINSIGNAGNYWFISHSAESAGKVTKTDDAANFTITSIYDTQIFTLGDSSVTKKLLGTTLTFEALPAAGVARLFYKKDAETAFTRIFTHGTDDSLSHSAVRVEIGSDTVTMTIASPAVVTLTNHDLVAGQAIIFRTTGALPTGVTAGTTYYVKSTGLAANTFQFSATAGTDGTAVDTSGSQSGTHTLERDANLPEYKEIQFRIESTGNGVITGLKFKSEILDKDMY